MKIIKNNARAIYHNNTEKEVEIHYQDLYKKYQENIKNDHVDEYGLSVDGTDAIGTDSISIQLECDQETVDLINDLSLHMENENSMQYSHQFEFNKDDELCFIEPKHLKDKISLYDLWTFTCSYTERMVKTMLNEGAEKKDIESILPRSAKRTVRLNASVNAWNDFLHIKDAEKNREYQSLCSMISSELKKYYPAFFCNAE